MKYTYSENLDAADRCPWGIHCLVGMGLCIIGMIFEHPISLFDEMPQLFLPFLLFTALGGMVLSIFSYLLMLIFPAPYARHVRKVEQHEANYLAAHDLIA